MLLEKGDPRGVRLGSENCWILEQKMFFFRFLTISNLRSLKVSALIPEANFGILIVFFLMCVNYLLLYINKILTNKYLINHLRNLLTMKVNFGDFTIQNKEKEVLKNEN